MSPIDTQNERRDESGRFVKGHKPPRSPGRPPGPNGLKARAAKLASAELERLVGQAISTIETGLESGDTRIAAWLIDRVRGNKKLAFMEMELPQNPTDPKDLVSLGEHILSAVGRGEMPLGDAHSFVDLITKVGGMRVALELDELRRDLDDFIRNGATSISDRTPERRMKELGFEWGTALAK